MLISFGALAEYPNGIYNNNVYWPDPNGRRGDEDYDQWNQDYNSCIDSVFPLIDEKFITLVGEDDHRNDKWNNAVELEFQDHYVQCMRAKGHDVEF
jgi:hypothetical protein